MSRLGFVIPFGRRRRLIPVKGGRSEKRRCPDCGETAVFSEHMEKTSFHVVFVDLWDSKDPTFVCGNCGEAMDLEDTEAPELSMWEQRKERKRLEKEREEAEKARAQREKEKAARAKREAAEIEDELAALKRKVKR